jgi:hypothetical protein
MISNKQVVLHRAWIMLVALRNILDILLLGPLGALRPWSAVSDQGHKALGESAHEAFVGR